MMRRIGRLLESADATRYLWLLNIGMAVASFMAFRHQYGGDLWSYTALADGILHGDYSMWWWLGEDIPDTFRNPGYPLFLAVFRVFTTSLLPIQVAQFLLYFLSLVIIHRLIAKLGGSTLASNLFLLLVLPSLQLPYMVTTIFPEILTMFLISAFIWVDWNWSTGWKRAIALGLLVGLISQCRSTVMLFPLAWLIASRLWARRKPGWGEAGLFILLFVATIMPYSLWNLKHHGVLKPVPIEGGGGVLHMGWWAGKIPGHTEHWYWGNFAIHELYQATPRDSIAGNIAAYEAEWAAIDSSLRPLLTATDSAMLRAQGPAMFRTYNTAYTSAREKALVAATLRHVLDEPWYTIKWKAYSAIRLWVTGIDTEAYRRAGLTGRLTMLYPFLSSLVIFMLFITLVPWAMWAYRELPRRYWPLLLWVIYFGMVNIPFVIQARYTVPVRLLMLALIALSMERLVVSCRKGSVEGG